MVFFFPIEEIYLLYCKSKKLCGTIINTPSPHLQYDDFIVRLPVIIVY